MAILRYESMGAIILVPPVSTCSVPQYANMPHCHSCPGCPWGLNARWRAPPWWLGSSVITAVTHSSRADVPLVQRRGGQTLVLRCDILRGSKSPEKAFFFSSSWVTRVQLAPSRLINSSNEPWLFNTYKCNGASTLAVLFHIMRSLQIMLLWFQDLIFFPL